LTLSQFGRCPGSSEGLGEAILPPHFSIVFRTHFLNNAAGKTNPDQTRAARGKLGFIMLFATLLAFGVAFGIATLLGADSKTIGVAMIAVAVGSIATIGPIVMKFGRETFGVAVMFAGAARMLLALGVCYFARESSPELMTRPLFLGVGSAVLLLMVVEVWTAIRILSAMEREHGPAFNKADDTQRKAA